jgi:hypothetical protein
VVARNAKRRSCGRPTTTARYKTPVGNSRKLKGVPVLSLNLRSQEPHRKERYPRIVFCLSSLVELDEQRGHSCDIGTTSAWMHRAYSPLTSAPSSDRTL